MSAAQRDKGAATCDKCGRVGSKGFRLNRLGRVVCMAERSCRRRARYPARAGELRVTDADYAARLSAQGGGCALCGTKPKTRRLDVDHDHRTGEVRGLLCHRCNRALPTWVDDRWLIAAVEYLAADVDAAHGPRVGGAATTRPRPHDGRGGENDGD